MSLPPTTRALVFDCDGTLADTMPLHQLAWEDACSRYGHEFTWELHQRYAGVHTRQIMQILVDEHGWKLPVDEAAVLKERLFEDYIPRVRAIPEVVKFVHDHAGKLPMAVASGGERPNVVRTLEVLGLAHHFQTIVVAKEVPHGKPAPDIYLEAARRLGIPPEHCTAFEDADMGIQSATAAGMHVIDIRPLLPR